MEVRIIFLGALWQRIQGVPEYSRIGTSGRISCQVPGQDRGHPGRCIPSACFAIIFQVMTVSLQSASSHSSECPLHRSWISPPTYQQLVSTASQSQTGCARGYPLRDSGFSHTVHPYPGPAASYRTRTGRMSFGRCNTLNKLSTDCAPCDFLLLFHESGEPWNNQEKNLL